MGVAAGRGEEETFVAAGSDRVMTGAGALNCQDTAGLVRKSEVCAPENDLRDLQGNSLSLNVQCAEWTVLKSIKRRQMYD